jgi:hypothetical protein
MLSIVNENSTIEKKPVKKKKVKDKKTLKDWVEQVEKEKLNENTTAGMKPFAVLDPKNQQAGAAVLKSTNPAVQNMLKGLNPRDIQIVMTQQSNQTTGATNANQTAQQQKPGQQTQPTTSTPRPGTTQPATPTSTTQMVRDDVEVDETVGAKLRKFIPMLAKWQIENKKNRYSSQADQIEQLMKNRGMDPSKDSLVGKYKRLSNRIGKLQKK